MGFNLVFKGLINDILQTVNNILPVGGIFCDIQEALHFIHNDFFLSKLEFYSTVGSARTLITSCIKDSYQEVLINRDSSLW